MIKYQDIYRHLEATDLLEDNRRWNTKDQHLAEAAMVKFTTEKSAPEHSADNIQWILSRARDHGVDLAVIRSNSLQLLGGRDTKQAMRQVLPESWLQEFQQFSGREWSVGEARTETTEQGTCTSQYLYRDCVVMPGVQGVYEVASGKRLTRRADIIDRIWNWGWPTRRGRPLSVGTLRWTGSREELTLARELYDQHYLRRQGSEVAKKICQAYSTMVRSYTWPGN